MAFAPVKTVSSSPFKSNGSSGSIRNSGSIKTVTSTYKPAPAAREVPTARRTAPRNSSARMSVTFEDASPVDDGLTPCGQCGRRFNPDRIGKHEGVCLGPEGQKPKQQEIRKPVKFNKVVLSF